MTSIAIATPSTSDTFPLQPQNSLMQSSCGDDLRSLSALQEPKRRGRPAKTIPNPFHGHIGPTTYWGRYPGFTQDILEGIARLDWHDRPIGSGGSSKPLSVRCLVDILADIKSVTAAAVQLHCGIGLRQSQRYVKAIELAMPYLMKSRPDSLAFEMAHGFLKIEASPEWLDDGQLHPPTPEILAKLHHDLRTLGSGTTHD